FLYSSLFCLYNSLFSRSFCPLLSLSFPTRRSSDLFADAVPSPESIVDLGKAGNVRGQWDRITRSRVLWREKPYVRIRMLVPQDRDRKSTRLNSSHVKISYAVFCLKKKTPQHDYYRC